MITSYSKESLAIRTVSFTAAVDLLPVFAATVFFEAVEQAIMVNSRPNIKRDFFINFVSDLNLRINEERFEVFNSLYRKVLRC